MHIPVVWSPETRRHLPRHEVWVGVPNPGTVVPERVDAILAALSGRPLHEAVPHGDEVLERIHTGELLAFLAGAARAWAAAPSEDLVGQDRVVPYDVPTAALLAGMEPTPATALLAQTGKYC